MQQYITWGYFGHFGPENGPKLVQKLLTIRPQNGLKFVPNGPQNNFQTTPAILNSCGQYYLTLLGGKQVILSEEGWKPAQNSSFG